MNVDKLFRMMPKSIRWKHSLTSSIWILLASTAWANVVITGTRIIYPESAREVTVKLDNRGDKPALVQTWIDNGDSKTQADKADVPCVLLPPVFRIEPGRAQTLKMTYTHDPLPQDRESMFWLNVLDIPPNPDSNESTNLLRLAFRSRLKIFFRPEGLSAEGAAAAATAVTWKLVRAPRGEGFAVEAGNASP
ncbi:fimbria/pilus periplasmic chaperone [Paraburkholderia xenovorans]|uniref:fimbria/pilus periplasmic chaperone n=1 Tax=Paraburkholderia xenovorans TaxID=36873 RepID=UPI0038B88B8F